MKNLAVYTFALILGLSAVSKAEITSYALTNAVHETPAKTICIKNAKASDIDKFFSTTKSLYFEVYKPGSKADFTAIMDKLKANESVESCVSGTINGDYYAITITLKSMKDKAWFVKLFKEAGLEAIKINANAVVELDKL